MTFQRDLKKLKIITCNDLHGLQERTNTFVESSEVFQVCDLRIHPLGPDEWVVYITYRPHWGGETT